jgi:protein ECT2
MHPGRPASRNSERPRGPRSPSPLPQGGLPFPHPPEEDMTLEIEAALNTLHPLPSRTPSPSRNRDRDRTVRPSTKHPQRMIEPLAIKKRDALGDTPVPRKPMSKTSAVTGGRVVSARRISPVIRHHGKPRLSSSSIDEEKLVRLHDILRDEVQ